MKIVDKNKFLCSYPYRTRNVEEYDAIYTNAPDSILEPFVKNGARIYNR